MRPDRTLDIRQSRFDGDLRGIDLKLKRRADRVERLFLQWVRDHRVLQRTSYLEIGSVTASLSPCESETCQKEICMVLTDCHPGNQWIPNVLIAWDESD